MWIATNTAFVSVVEHRDDRDLVIVRGRIRGDVERFLNPLPSGLRVIEEVTPDADYRFRATVDRRAFMHALMRAGRGVKYPNFKGSVRAKRRHDLYLQLWGVLRSAQQILAGVRART